jgi:FkbM family methyltransferase
MNSPRPADWRDRFVVRWLRGPGHPAKLRLLRWARSLLGLREIVVEAAPGVRFRLDDRDFVEREILQHGAYEPRTLALARRLLAGGRAFVDVGAHIGQYSLHAAAVLGPGGSVVAFEPSPATAARLRANLALSGATTVALHQFALGDRPAVAELRAPAWHAVHGYNSGGSTLAASAGGTGCAVAVLPCDAVPALRALPSIDLMKLDVEGYELPVLRSLFGGGLPPPRHLLIEYLPDNFPHREIPALLRARGYALADIDGRPIEGEPPAELPEGNLWARLAP